ncbi:MAG: phosphoglucomutase/phosphomannomutase family protein [Deltaproteobacteria bacterium]|nr:phosphoglucomutase/phosphomannomutase family protein [Deltaproteobacteria bacterium]
MKRTSVKFGTSGWRAVLCDDFTFENVRLVTQAIADHLAAAAAGSDAPSILVGYDTRFLGERFARLSCEVLAGNGIAAALCSRDAPTPVLSFDILRHGRSGAINFTASHNPPEWNGIKFSPAWGGPALPETTADIEGRANARMESGEYRSLPFEDALAQGLVTVHDPRPAYLDRLRELVDFDAIRAAGLRLALDPLFGTGRGYLDTLLAEAGCRVTTIHGAPDPLFGGRPPEPSESHIPELVETVRADRSFHLGLATDGDADRFGIVDAGGRFLEPNYFLALLFDYLVRDRSFPGGVARSVATTHLIDAVARDLGRPVHETPVGFKFIGDLIRRGEVALGGEESAGLSIRGHVPEKDGILACCLAAEMVARRGKPLFQQLEELYGRVGRTLTCRVNLPLTPAQETALAGKLVSPPASFDGRAVVGAVTLDGHKFLLDGGAWVLVRKSGTEPVVRLYVEAGDEESLSRLTEASRTWILAQGKEHA